MNRYTRQLSLPEITPQNQASLAQSKIIMVGAGGLGSAALPYLAGAGIGCITIIDHDSVDISNLHRQTIYRTDQFGKNKAICAKSYLNALNPNIDITAINKQINPQNAAKIIATYSPDLILDGSDNFATKSLLNNVSIELEIPLITASITGFEGQIGSFEGYKPDGPCYRCLFPELPESPEPPQSINNTNIDGVLGTSAAIIGTMQAHITLCRLLDIKLGHNNDETPFTRIDLKTLKIRHYTIAKDPNCFYCHHIV